MRKVVSISVFATIVAFAIACNQTNSEQKIETSTTQQINVSNRSDSTVYQKAGVIKVRDPKAVMFGYRQPGDDIFEFTIDDVGKFTSHVCAGVISAFLLTQQSLDLLYPGDELPIRGQIGIVASDLTDHLEVAAYIVRASAHGEEETTGSTAVDTTLRIGKGKVVLIFKRLDNGKMVKAVFDKTVLMQSDNMQKIQALKSKVMNGTASDVEKKEFAENVQKTIEKIIADTPEGLITITECTDYVFKE